MTGVAAGSEEYALDRAYDRIQRAADSISTRALFRRKEDKQTTGYEKKDNRCVSDCARHDVGMDVSRSERRTAAPEPLEL